MSARAPGHVAVSPESQLHDFDLHFDLQLVSRPAFLLLVNSWVGDSVLYDYTAWLYWFCYYFAVLRVLLAPAPVTP